MALVMVREAFRAFCLHFIARITLISFKFMIHAQYLAAAAVVGVYFNKFRQNEGHCVVNFYFIFLCIGNKR